MWSPARPLVHSITITNNIRKSIGYSPSASPSSIPSDSPSASTSPSSTPSDFPSACPSADDVPACEVESVELNTANFCSGNTDAATGGSGTYPTNTLFKLNGDVECINGGFLLYGDDNVLDCGGNSISYVGGVDMFIGGGVRVGGSNVFVKDCVITGGWAFGIQAIEMDRPWSNLSVERTRVSGASQSGITLDGSTGSTAVITGSQFNDGNFGISVGSNIVTYISDSETNDNDFIGVFVTGVSSDASDGTKAIVTRHKSMRNGRGFSLAFGSPSARVRDSINCDNTSEDFGTTLSFATFDYANIGVTCDQAQFCDCSCDS
ncbi:MAG: hypothetical protein SGILL_004242 [Bacillariaceae sp.]